MKLVDLDLGPMPVETLNSTLMLDLEPGTVRLTRAAQAHVLRRRPEDYARLLPQLAAVVANPLYAGDDHKNVGKIELVARVRANEGFILVAVNLKRARDGSYHVASFYPVTVEKIEGRRRRGFLRNIRP